MEHICNLNRFLGGLSNKIQKFLYFLYKIYDLGSGATWQQFVQFESCKNIWIKWFSTFWKLLLLFLLSVIYLLDFAFLWILPFSPCSNCLIKKNIPTFRKLFLFQGDPGDIPGSLILFWEHSWNPICYPPANNLGQDSPRLYLYYLSLWLALYQSKTLLVEKTVIVELGESWPRVWK